MVRNSPLPLGFAAFVGAGLLVERDAGSFGELLAVQAPAGGQEHEPGARGSLRGRLARWRRSAERRPSVSRPRAARSSIPSTAATSSTQQPAMPRSATAARRQRRPPDRVEMLDDNGMRPYGAPRAVSSTERLSQAS
jgi:hypothetical protein